MKNFLSIFFTMPSKIIFSIILFVLALFLGDTNIEYFRLYSADNESFINATIQIDSFNYETSHYLKNTVKTTIENTVKLAMEYEEVFENNSDADKLLSYYSGIGDSSFSQIYNNLASMKGFRFAFVNNEKKIIRSNIAAINGASSTTDVQKYFGTAGRTLLVARNSKNPYFATDTFIEYAELIRTLSEKYGADFDLYISFGTEESFAENEQKCKELHFAMREKIEKLNNSTALYGAMLLVMILILLTVTGKQEPGGKTYSTIINRLPNDLIVLMYTIMLICLGSLYRTASSMLISHGNELDEFWFTRSPEFYTSRIKFCIVTFICIATNLMCILKREYKLGLLVKNTFIYFNIENLKKIWPKKPADNKTEKN